MLLKSATLEGISEGRISLQFRRWKRPTVKRGGTLLTPIGTLSIEAVEVVDPASISDADARAAGFEDASRLMKALAPRRRSREGGSSGTKRSGQAGDSPQSGDVYRIALRLAGPDPRIALREAEPSEADLIDIFARLDRWDEASPLGPWTHATMRAIAESPEVRAGDIAERLGFERTRFKTNVRKLKGLGLTESRKIGYRLSPRGRAVLESRGE